MLKRVRIFRFINAKHFASSLPLQHIRKGLLATVFTPVLQIFHDNHAFPSELRYVANCHPSARMRASLPSGSERGKRARGERKGEHTTKSRRELKGLLSISLFSFCLSFSVELPQDRSLPKLLDLQFRAVRNRVGREQFTYLVEERKGGRSAILSDFAELHSSHVNGNIEIQRRASVPPPSFFSGYESRGGDAATNSRLTSLPSPSFLSVLFLPFLLVFNNCQATRRATIRLFVKL